ncbi:MAG TPA: sigma-54 dependent transcriptional regulator [Terriglobia bacterium]|nr:sigma-54 dependent transcriptional regulator [Terriglobia bacterium]
MIGTSDVMKRLFDRIRMAARVSGAVLISGETGSGKELVARAIHQASGRSGRFVAVDCGAVPEDLIESELFGYRRGAFTTAMTDKAGLFEEAQGGTLFLDEIANTSRRFQAKLLRALQERQTRRIGDLVYRALDIRVIAACNCDLRELVARGEFREDLYYRLNVFGVRVPPLRERREDIPLLVDAILQSRKRISASALERLQSYAFPGNVRELENVIESAVYTAPGGTIEIQHLSIVAEPVEREAPDRLEVRNFWESVARPYADRLITRRHVEDVVRAGLERTGGSYRKLMALFNMPESDYKRFMDFLRRHRCHVDYREFRKRAAERPHDTGEIES